MSEAEPELACSQSHLAKENIMKLCQFHLDGRKRAGLLDADSWNLSPFRSAIAPEVLSPAGLDALRAVDPSTLAMPRMQRASPRPKIDDKVYLHRSQLGYGKATC